MAPDTDPVTIVAAQERDAAAVASIYLRSRAAAEVSGTMPTGLHSAAETDDFVRDVVLSRREAWLAVLAGQAVGVLVLEHDDLDWLFVLPEAQGRGVGAALLEQAKRERPGGLALWVFTVNAPARAFYERRGFRAVRETDGAGNEEREPDVRYIWGLHAEGLTTPDPAP